VGGENVKKRGCEGFYRWYKVCST